MKDGFNLAKNKVTAAVEVTAANFQGRGIRWMNFRISQLSLRLVIEKNRVQRGFFVDKLWPMAALGLPSRRKISNIASVTPEVHYLIKLQPPSYAGRKKEPRYFLDIEIIGLLERRLRAANLDSATLFFLSLFFFYFIFKNAVEQTGSTRFRTRGNYLCRSMTIFLSAILGEVLIIGQVFRILKDVQLWTIKDKCIVKQDVTSVILHKGKVIAGISLVLGKEITILYRQNNSSEIHSCIFLYETRVKD